MSVSVDLEASLQRAGVKPQGTLVLSVQDGAVLEGTGDLNGSGGARVGATIFAMLKDAAGIVRFAQNDRVRIVEWNLNGVEGNGDYPLGVNQPKAGDESTTDGWLCVVDRPEAVETYYGTYSDVLSFLCEGEEGPVGDWHFAKDVGLVAYDGDDYSLSLVAPW